MHLAGFGLERLLNWRVALFLVAFAALPFVNAANLTAAALQPANNSNFTAGLSIGLQVNCSSNGTLTNATAYLYYYNNATYYGSYSNTSAIANNTNFNISFASPLHESNFTWYVQCSDTASAPVLSSNLTFNLRTSYYLTSMLTSPADASAQTAGNTVSLIGNCTGNSTLTGGRFWVYRSTGADYISYANTSAITNGTAFSVSFYIPAVDTTTWYWNLQCMDRYSQTANATANYSFIASPVLGSSGGTGTGCTTSSQCSSGYYCLSGGCTKCEYGSDGICRVCAAEIGLIDPDCEEAEPTAEPTAAPTQTPTTQPTIEPSIAPSPEATANPTQAPEVTGTTYAEANAEIEAAQSMQGASTNADAKALIDLAMASLEAGDYANAKAYAEQAQAVLLSVNQPAETKAGGFNWTLPVIFLAVVLAAIAYFATKKKPGL